MTLPATGIKAASTVDKGASDIQSANLLISSEVHNKEDKKLGTIKDLMIDTANGNTVYAVLSFGGFWGMGESLSAIPWRAITFDNAKKRFLLDIEIERLKAAPSFDKDSWPNMNDNHWASKVDRYFTKGATH